MGGDRCEGDGSPCEKQQDLIAGNGAAMPALLYHDWFKRAGSAGQ
jgi:hypothetical protein